MSTQKCKPILVSDVMLELKSIPVINQKVILKEALEVMGRNHLGIICITSEKNNKLMGILTDGDIRRKLLKIQKPFSAFFIDDALDHAILTPLTIKPNDTIVEAVKIMEKKRIWDLPVINENGSLVGLMHLHPAISALLKTS
jgi:CBS domain-containing protein